MIYLDHAAATPVDERVLTEMLPYLRQDFFNPSAAYLPAKKVAADYEVAKQTIAHAIGAKSTDLVITSGATEANNLAFTVVGNDEHGRVTVAEGVPRRACEVGEDSDRQDPPRVLYLETEHDSVRSVAAHLGGQSVKVLPSGLVDLADLRAKITDETELVSVSLVNNELGVIQPIAEIAGILREVRASRLDRGVLTPLLLHSDASQALHLLDISVHRLGVDLMTLNSAKVYGPKGVGALYRARGVRLHPLVVGGGQENGLRSGTENVPGVIGFAAATELAHEHIVSNRKKYSTWREILLRELEDYELVIKKHTLDNFLTICYNGIDAERLIYILEDQGVYVATGAACAASKGVRSHVLAAIGLSESQIAGSLRLTMGETNTEEQIHAAARLINAAVRAERARLAQR